MYPLYHYIHCWNLKSDWLKALAVIQIRGLYIKCMAYYSYNTSKIPSIIDLIMLSVRWHLCNINKMNLQCWSFPTGSKFITLGKSLRLLGHTTGLLLFLNDIGNHSTTANALTNCFVDVSQHLLWYEWNKTWESIEEVEQSYNNSTSGQISLHKRNKPSVSSYNGYI